MPSRRRLWFLVRIAVYLAVIMMLLLYRGGVPWRRFVSTLKSTGDASPALVIAGRDLAPPLIERLAAEYRLDYPSLQVTVNRGGTNEALENLLAGKADIAFLLRRPTMREQAYFREADRDTAVVVPVAVGAIVLVAGTEADAGPLTVSALRALLGREPGTDRTAYCSRLYVPDPNEGLWDALHGGLGLGAPDADTDSTVVYLADARSVLDAVTRDPHSWGLVSLLDSGLELQDGPPAGTRFVGIVAVDGQAPVAPTNGNVASGDYPLHHFLYVACRGTGGIEGAKFVTHLGSARGLRLVERAGAVPARLVARQIQLTRDPVAGE